MLDSLHVKDMALIKETEIEFGPGLNILTGETGAGKSVVIGSVVMALGGKVSKDIIRTGAESALAELIFTVDDDRIRDKCGELGIDIEDDQIVISRKVSATKSLSRINGETVPLKVVKELSALLLDVCGQHEHQSLTSERVQADILDGFCGRKLADQKAELAVEYAKYRKLSKELEEATKDTASREKELNLARYEVDDIEGAELSPGEDVELEDRYRFMSSSIDTSEALSAAERALSGDGSDNAAFYIDAALRELKRAVSKDPAATDLLDAVEAVNDSVFELQQSIIRRLESMDFEPREFDEVSERLDRINTIKNRYGATIDEVFAYRDERLAFIDKYSNYDEYIDRLSADVEASKARVLELCAQLSGLRKKGAKALGKKMIEALSDLSFAQVLFEIRVEGDESRMGAGGYDTIEWLISVNPGQELRPISAIASGGELSRIMLGLKTVMADAGDTDTLIFDEIDAGISGKTAWQVSKKLGLLSKSHQIICITHLPQIAAMGDAHYLIEKRQEGGVMGTDIRPLDGEGSIVELSRLLGADSAGDAAMENARELRDRAVKEKA